jgi:nitrate/TMAO reductase-like tetraheme cytochrome c subunit
VVVTMAIASSSEEFCVGCHKGDGEDGLLSKLHVYK